MSMLVLFVVVGTFGCICLLVDGVVVVTLFLDLEWAWPCEIYPHHSDTASKFTEHRGNVHELRI
jgi:hypothetical protein